MNRSTQLVRTPLRLSDTAASNDEGRILAITDGTKMEPVGMFVSVACAILTSAK